MSGKTCVLVLLLCTLNVQCARILGVFNIPSISHQIVFQPIWKELSLRGHEVVVMTPNPLNDPSLVNLTEIDLGFLYRQMEDFKVDASKRIKHWDMTEQLIPFFTTTTEEFFNYSEVLEIIKDNETTFDVVLAEAVMPTTFAFAAKFKCPLIGIASLGVPEQVHASIGTILHPVLYPDLLTDYAGELSFMRRVDAVLFDLYSRYNWWYRTVPVINAITKKYFGDDIKSYEEMVKSISILLLNTNPVLHTPRPYGPNVIEMGGRLHLKPKKPLPTELQQFLDNSTEGVIYFSLGSNVKSKYLDETKRKAIMDAFSELPYKILWKFEDDELEGKPTNVKINKWLPQQDLLHHPNIKLFITQAGLQSLEEGLTKGLPFLAIPFMADQFQNAETIQRLGFGLKLDYDDLTKDTLKSAILEIVNNPNYKKKAEEVGRLIQDQAVSGVEKAVWWTEYVIRNKGAPHLRSLAVDMPWHEYYLLDVYGFLFLIAVSVLYVAYRLFKFVVNTVLSSQKKEKQL